MTTTETIKAIDAEIKRQEAELQRLREERAAIAQEENQVDKIFDAVLSCPHDITAESVALHFSPKQAGHNSLSQLRHRLADYDLAARQRELQLLGEIEALEEMKQLRAKATPIAWYVTGCSTMLDEHDAKAEAKRCGGSAKAVPLYTAPPVQQQPDSNKAAECICTNLPDFEKLDRGFRWVSEKQHHVPTLLIEFVPIPANPSANEKGWQDRDALAAFLADRAK